MCFNHNLTFVRITFNTNSCHNCRELLYSFLAHQLDVLTMFDFKCEKRFCNMTCKTK